MWHARSANVPREFNHRQSHTANTGMHWTRNGSVLSRDHAPNRLQVMPDVEFVGKVNFHKFAVNKIKYIRFMNSKIQYVVSNLLS